MGCGLSKVHIHPEVLVSHRNARTTFHGRLLIVQRHRAGWPQAHIAAAMGVSRRCVKNWIDRYAAEGEAGLHDRSSRPHRTPTRTRAEVEAARRRAAPPGTSRAGLDRRRARRPGPDRVAGPRPPRRAAAGEPGPDHRRADPGLQGHRGPLRTRTPRRAGPHGRQEARPDPRRRRLARPRPRDAAATARPTRPRSATTTSTPWSTTTPGWPTPRSCPTRRAPPAPAFLDRADRLLRRPRHHPHRAADDRQRLGLPVVATRAVRRTTASGRSSSSPTAPGRTARSNASTAPCRPSGPTARSSPATTNAPPPLRPGSSTTTLNAATAHSEDYPPISRLPPT